MSRLIISGTGSGSGKTTVTCAILAALKRRGESPTAFKCGPDYIDPMFHRAVTGVAAYNLDPFFLDADALRNQLASKGGEISVIEGAMGYYDGIAATDVSSAYTVSAATETPVVLVVSAKGAGHSLAALIEGFVHHRTDSRICGVIFNDASSSRYPDLKKIAAEAGVRAYGYLPRNKDWTLQSRHLGLLTADEISGLQEQLAALGSQAEESIDIDGLLELASTASAMLRQPAKPHQADGGLRVAVAKDAAFCFLYEENLQLLQQMGCQLCFFSPISDAALPEDISGLYLCGGYPELYADKLSENKSMRESIRCAVAGGLPTIAECGGFLYLHEGLDGKQMCGVIKGNAVGTERLQRFGYITLTAAEDNLLCRQGESIRAHEFHYWESPNCGSSFIAKKAGRERTYPCIHATSSLYAGFPHLYLPANPQFAENFVSSVKRYRF